MTTTTMDESLLGAVESSAPAAKKKRAIPVRAMGFQFAEKVPRFWFFGSPHVTHLSNALNSLFPDGERFFIRSVKHYVDQLGDDPELLARVRGFFGQEGRHGHEHERWNKILKEQGYDIESFLEQHGKIAYETLEPNVSPALRLSVTVALEHFTATMARNGLRGDFLDNAHPVMADLLRWHAAEEIEHKSVAFDVFQKVDGRYHVRVLGLFIALAGLLTSWRAGTKHLMRQEAKRGTDLKSLGAWLKENPRIKQEEGRRKDMFREAILDYLRPDFHPDQVDDYALARDYLASVGRLDG
jgi:predicted metal-dependent hydrolase